MRQVNDDDIQDVINEFTDNQLMFTIYDVTKKLRNDGFIVMHHDVKRYFREQDNLNSYYDSIIHPDLNAMVYHPKVQFGYLVNLDNYNPDAIPELVKCDCLGLNCSHSTGLDDTLDPIVVDNNTSSKYNNIKNCILRLFTK